MLKKFFVITFIFLFSAILLAEQKKDGSASFYFNTDRGYFEYTNISDQSKNGVNFTGGKSTVDLTPGSYKFQFFSPTYFPVEKIITVSREYQSYNIDFQKKSDDFFISVKKSGKNEIHFSEDPPDTAHVLKNISILFYKDGKIIKNVYSDSFLEKVELDFGQYDIVVKDRDKILMRSQRFPINERYGNYLTFFLKPSESYVEGVLKVDDMYIGGTEIVFTDAENNNYILNSDFSGKFSGHIPSRKYKVSIKKFGYSLKKENQLIYDFTNEDKKFYLNLELEESPSFIEGRIIDERKMPVSGAEVIIKNRDEEIKSFTDNFGRFHGTVKPGLVLVKIEKKGFFSHGIVRRIEKFSTVSNLEVEIKRKVYQITGVLSDGIRPIKSERIDLINSSGIRVASTLSGENGYFEFIGIPATEDFRISVRLSNFKPYTSRVFNLKENLNNFNIIMKKPSRQIILEVTDNSGAPFVNTNFNLDGHPVKTDSNGITSYLTDSDSIALLYKNQKKKISLDGEKSVYKINLN